MRWTACSCLLLLFGCGGEVSDASADDDAAPSVATCDRSQGVQTIAHVPGFPWSVASAGGIIYVASQIPPADGSPFSSTQSTLYRVDADGSAHAVTDDFVDPYSVTSLGSTLAFLHVIFTAGGVPYDDAVETIAADGSLTTLESSSDQTSFSALTSDGASEFHWYRWAPDRDANSIPAIERSAPSSAPTELAIGPDVTGVGDFATDGASYFAAFVRADSSAALGRMPVDDTPALELVNDPNAQVAGVDSKNVYYLTSPPGQQRSQLWSVSKSGGSPTALASLPPIPRVVLRDGTAYWIEYESTQDNIMSVSLDGLSQTSEVSATSLFIASIAANECGLVMAASDPDDGESTIVMQLPL